jgi:hypothetical protein
LTGWTPPSNDILAIMLGLDRTVLPSRYCTRVRRPSRRSIYITISLPHAHKCLRDLPCRCRDRFVEHAHFCGFRVRGLGREAATHEQQRPSRYFRSVFRTTILINVHNDVSQNMLHRCCRLVASIAGVNFSRWMDSGWRLAQGAGQLRAS